MARKRPSSNKSDIRDLVTRVQQNMDALHRVTYYSDPTGDHDIDDLTQKINKNIGNIVKYNMNTSGVPSITKLYSRMMEKR